VTLDVDAPIGTFSGAQHADRARFDVECDDAPGTGDGFLLDLGIHGDRCRFEHRLERQPHAFPKAAEWESDLLVAHLEHHFEDRDNGNVGKGDGDEPEPRQPLELVFSKSRPRPSDPDDHKDE